MLEIRDLNLSFGNRIIFSDFSLRVNTGEVVAVLGKSGVGKSTLLRVIAGLEVPDSGNVLINEVDVTRMPTYKRGIGLVFQDNALFPHLNVKDNIGFGLRTLPKAQRRIRIVDLLKLTDTESLAERSIDALSGGEAKRVALARTLASRPAIVLLDEPLTGLDPELKDQLRLDLVQMLKNNNTTVIWVTHDEAEANSVADRIIYL